MEIAEPPLVIPRHRLTVDRYYRMAETGVLDPDARVELIEEIIDTAPMLSRHAGVLSRLQDRLGIVVSEAVQQRVQLPLRLSRHSEPEPDLALVQRRGHDYIGSHPTAADVLLAVEVADSSLAYDLRVKTPLYARHGVPEVWVVDLPARRLHRFHDPAAGAYRHAQVLDTPEALPIWRLPGSSIRLAGLFDGVIADR